MHILRTEKALWLYIKPRLKGLHWTRLENTVGRGAGDAYGFFREETHWIELKVGKPAANKLRPSQRNFIADCLDQGIPVWVCFAWKNEPVWFKGWMLHPLTENLSLPVTPPFWSTRPLVRPARRSALTGLRTPILPETAS